MSNNDFLFHRKERTCHSCGQVTLVEQKVLNSTSRHDDGSSIERNLKERQDESNASIEVPNRQVHTARERSTRTIQREGDLVSGLLFAENQILFFDVLFAYLSFESFSIFHQPQLFRPQFLFFVALESLAEHRDRAIG